MKKIIHYCILGVAIIVFVSIALYTHYLTKPRYNDTYVNGNTAGNLYNDGLFAEDDEYIYFSNPSDGYRLYRMAKDGSDTEKICDDSVAYINVDDNYVYYVRTGDHDESSFSFLHVNTHSLCKILKDGKGEVVILDDDPAIYASLVGNYIYYLHYVKTEGTTLYRVKIDGEEREQVYPQPYFTCSTNGQYIYYNGLENDHNIYEYDTATGSQNLLYAGNCWMPIVDGNTVYFMDCLDNYSLAKVDLSTLEKTTLCNDRIDCFNVHNGTIYFQRNNNSALCSIGTDGSDYTTIKEGIYTDINVAGNKLYFKEYNNDLFFQMPLSGGAVSPFIPSVEK